MSKSKTSGNTRYQVQDTADGAAVVRLRDGAETVFLGSCGMTSREEAEEAERLMLGHQKAEHDYYWSTDATTPPCSDDADPC